MGKLSLNKKKPLDDGNKQKKISAFFQSGNDAVKSASSSSLFQSVGASHSATSLTNSSAKCNTVPAAKVQSKVPLLFRDANTIPCKLLNNKVPAVNSNITLNKEESATVIIKPYDQKKSKLNVKGTNKLCNSSNIQLDFKSKENNDQQKGKKNNNEILSDEKTIIPESQIVDDDTSIHTPVRKYSKSNLTLSNTKTSSNITASNSFVRSPATGDGSFVESDCDMIPATPQASIKSGQNESASGRKRIYNSRSFLSATLSNKPPGIKPQTDKNKINSNRQPLARKAVIGDDCGWDRNDQTMGRVLTEAGIPDLARSTFGLTGGSNMINNVTTPAGFEDKRNKPTENLSNASNPTNFGQVKSERKRAHSSEDDTDFHAIPPNKKRLSIPSTQENNAMHFGKPSSKKVGALGIGTRGGIMLEKGLQYVPPKESDSESGSSEDEIVSNGSQLKLFSKEINSDEGTEQQDIKKFSWKSKNSNVSNSVSNSKSIEVKNMACDKIDKTCSSIKSGMDNNLDDILGELSASSKSSHLTYKLQTQTSKNNIPSVMLKKKKVPTATLR